MRERWITRWVGALLAGALLALGGCSPEYYRESADEEVATVLDAALASEPWSETELDEDFAIEDEQIDVRTIGTPALVQDFGSVPSPARYVDDVPEDDVPEDGGDASSDTIVPRAPEPANGTGERAPSTPDRRLRSGEGETLDDLDPSDSSAPDELAPEARTAPENEASPGARPPAEGGFDPDQEASPEPEHPGIDADADDDADSRSGSASSPESPDETARASAVEDVDLGASSRAGAGIEGRELPPGSRGGALVGPAAGLGLVAFGQAEEDGAQDEGGAVVPPLGDLEIEVGAEFEAAGAEAPLASLTAGIPGAKEVPSRIISLSDALTLAFANNREFRSAREAVYLAALDLTLARHAFAPNLFGIVTGDFRHEADGAEIGQVTGSWGWDQLFASGARLSVDVFQNALRFFAGGKGEVASTILSAALTQPLLRGFGTSVTLEPLIQAGRDLLYEIRAFRRFRTVFAVRVISEYYRVLQERDRITNEYNNWLSLVQNRSRVQALASAGRILQLEVDQARQQELQAEDRYSAAVSQYEAILDDFKFTLGIPVEERISLDPREFEALMERGVSPLPVSLDEAIAAAFERRVDWQTAIDELEDAERRVLVLRDALRAQLDVSAEVALASGEGASQKPLRFDTGDLEYGAGFTLELPFDRKRERNAWIASIIGYRRAERSLSLFEDEIRLTIRDAYRALEREIVSYPIQQTSVALAEARVESTTELRQAGRAQTRDVLESQAALIDARNALTRSLINYTVARLAFYRDMGALSVLPDGTVVELPIGSEEG